MSAQYPVIIVPAMTYSERTTVNFYSEGKLKGRLSIPQGAVTGRIYNYASFLTNKITPFFRTIYYYFLDTYGNVIGSGSLTFTDPSNEDVSIPSGAATLKLEAEGLSIRNLETYDRIVDKDVDYGLKSLVKVEFLASDGSVIDSGYLQAYVGSSGHNRITGSRSSTDLPFTFSISESITNTAQYYKSSPYIFRITNQLNCKLTVRYKDVNGVVLGEDTIDLTTVTLPYNWIPNVSVPVASIATTEIEIDKSDPEGDLPSVSLLILANTVLVTA